MAKEAILLEGTLSLPLHIVVAGASDTDTPIVRCVATAFPTAIYLKNDGVGTPLEIAVTKSSPKTLETLLAVARSDSDYDFMNHIQPLFDAITLKEDFDLVKVFLEDAAKATNECPYQKSPLEAACFTIFHTAANFKGDNIIFASLQWLAALAIQENRVDEIIGILNMLPQVPLAEEAPEKFSPLWLECRTLFEELVASYRDHNKTLKLSEIQTPLTRLKLTTPEPLSLQDWQDQQIRKIKHLLPNGQFSNIETLLNSPRRLRSEASSSGSAPDPLSGESPSRKPGSPR